VTDEVPVAARRPKCLAFYLPQFHPVAENDAWWGKGYTEWHNVAKARPLFRGHYQPHLPAELGFYDLRLPEARRAQAELAQEAGLDGFIYWHYWFGGRRLLERPLDEVVRLGEPDFGFCVCWANHDWVRRWAGGDNQVIIKQEYSPEDDLRHIRALRPMLTDHRYVTYLDRPVVVVYKGLPDPVATTDLWRTEAASWGLSGLYLLLLETSPESQQDPLASGFDGTVPLEPQWWNLPRRTPALRARTKFWRRLGRTFPSVLTYDSVAEAAIGRIGESMSLDYPRWPEVTVGYDNSPRYAGSRSPLVLHQVTPEKYGRWLRAALVASDRVSRRFTPDAGGIVAVNAWNEWGEGMHLEPDLRHGRAFLDVTRRTIDDFARSLDATRRGAPDAPSTEGSDIQAGR
jgi:lipopolysaccharide biosynthesis protein